MTEEHTSSGIEDADIDTLVEQISVLPPDWHAAGTLGTEVILAISETLRQRGLIGRLSAETGCGKSTLLLSHLSARHYCFAVGARDDSLARVKQSRLLSQERVEFIVGPSQLTLPKYELPESLAVALIDGAHGYPFPELDYYYLYQRVESGGILILDDIHIPTITHLYNVLREDPMWDHCLEVGTTAFFVRTDAPLFDPTADGWWLQPYNLRRFPAKESLERTLGEKWWETISLPEVKVTEFELGQATRIRSLEADLSESQAAVTRREGELAGLRSELEHVRSELEHVRSELEHVRSDLEHARKECEAGRQALALANAQFDAMLESHSWRVTAPLRAISTAARRMAAALSGAGNARSEKD